MNLFYFLLTIVALMVPVSWCQDARSYRQFLDTTVNACEDFYEYACGKWTPNNDEAVDVITDQKFENRYTLKQYFTSLRRRSGQQANSASEFYQLCVSSKYQSNEEILQDYMSVLLEISEWPYLNQTFVPSSFNSIQVAAKLRLHHVDTLFQLSIQRNWMDSTQHIIYLTPMKKQFSGPSDGDEAFMYKTYVKYLLLDFGVRVRKANIIAQEVVNFEVELDKLNLLADDKLIDPIPLQRLIRQMPGLDWRLYFETLLGVPLRSTQLVVVQADLFKSLEILLRKVKPETVAFFQLARFMRHYQVRMDPANWIDCIDETAAQMPLLVSQNFLNLRKTFSKAKVNEVFENIRTEFLAQINDTNWYDSASKNEIKSKLEAIDILIGYPDEELDSDLSYQIDRNSYQKSRILLDKLATNIEFSLLKQHTEVANINLRPLNVNAYYRLTANALEIPIGILQPPMYREDGNIAQVMGSLGSIIAHELVHGFDYDGQMYDKKGNVKQDTNPKAIIQFGLRANCFIDQYSGERVDALNEDIADNEGLRLAYGAYERTQKDREGSVDADQLFFISFAQVWCNSGMSTNKLRNHSSHKVRVNNVVSNSEEFAEAFSCRRGSKLNPVKKCQIW